MANRKRAKIKSLALFLGLFAAVLLALTFIGAGTAAAVGIGGDGGGGDDATTTPVYYIDIKPQSWPNPINVKSKGVLPVAILGSEGFVVSDYTIDTQNISLEGVHPLRFDIEDISRPPLEGAACNENTDGGDGYLDITLKFDMQEVVDALSAKFGPLYDGEPLTVTLSGKLTKNGTELDIQGSDCVVIRAR